MRTIKITVFLLTSFFLNSCAELTQIAQTAVSQNLPLTNDEIVGGLKDALLVGTDSTVAHLSAVDGYLKDQAIKIMLPPEAKTITDHISKLPGGAKLVDDVIIRINRAAEDAAKGGQTYFCEQREGNDFYRCFADFKRPRQRSNPIFQTENISTTGRIVSPQNP
jgi:hypothetical protein